jgi:hypothetical protein
VNMGYGAAAGECFSGAFCDHQEHGHHGHHHGGLVVPDELALMEHEVQGQGQVMVKHEEWDAREQGQEHGYH